jgi:NitT/TauT family transport system substrate-binding protein
MQIRLAENFRAVFYAPFYATIALGFHKEQGVDIALHDSPSPGAGIAELAAGNIDCMWGGPLRVIKERDQCPKTEDSIVAFCEVAAKDPFFLMGSPLLQPFELNDLTSLRLGVVSEVPTPWLCLEQDLRDLNINSGNIIKTSDQTMAQNATGLKQCTLDVAQLFEPYVSELELANDAVVLHAANQRGYTAYTTFITTYAKLERHAQAFEAMITAVEKFNPWLTEHGTAELAKVVQSFYPNVPSSVLERSMDRYHQAGLWTCRRAVSRQGFDRLVLSMQQSGFIQTTPSYEDCVAACSLAP